MKRKFDITGITVTLLDELLISMGSCYIHRREQTRMYSITNLTQYQRVVRLLNAFVDRNMK